MVCRLVSVPIQRKLLSDGNLTLPKAVDTSTGIEMASIGLIELPEKTDNPIGNKQGYQRRWSSKEKCRSEYKVKKLYQETLL